LGEWSKQKASANSWVALGSVGLESWRYPFLSEAVLAEIINAALYRGKSRR
jgi:hypothetical protein